MTSAARPAPREWLLLFVLSGIQFSQMVDFMVLMPLGTQLMRAFGITPTQLGFFVSIYAVAASLSGFFSALVIDRFDRRTAMLALYAFFAATMAACAAAPSYATLLAARTAAGAFGGVVAANIFTIVADVVPEGRRGRAFGAVMSAFSLASILGVPISLYLALHFTWRAPYVFLAVLCSAILLAAWFVIPPVRAHLVIGGERNALAQLGIVFGEANHLRIFAFSALLAARLVGKWSDSVGRRAVFAASAVATAIAAIAMTSLPRSPLFVAVLVSMLMFAATTARMVPAMALITSGAEPRLRGSVMSFNASIQQLAAGAASFVASLVVGRSVEGELTRYWMIGILSAAGTFICIALALAKQDVSVLVLEAEPGLSFDLRAGTYHPPSLEMMAPYGITEEMHKTAIKVPRWQIRDRREGVIVEWDVTEIGDLTPYPYRLHLEQHRLTPIILSKLREYPNAEVRFSHKLTDLSQAADKVTVTAATPGGTETFDAEWLVGADGGRSTVRKCTDVGFDGFTWDERFVVASTPYDYAPHGYALNAYLADPEEWAALFKMPDDGPPGIWRVIFPVPPEEEDAVTLSEEMVERRMQNFLPRKERYQIKYKSIYKVHQRVAKDFRLGRVLLAGDAAHLNNPMGAFGLNGGIHD